MNKKELEMSRRKLLIEVGIMKPESLQQKESRFKFAAPPDIPDERSVMSSMMSEVNSDEHDKKRSDTSSQAKSILRIKQKT